MVKRSENFSGTRFAFLLSMGRKATQYSYPGHPKDLLTHIIKVAKAAGFTFRNFLDDYDSFIITSFNQETGRMVFVLRNEEELRVVYDSIYTLFFDLSFARALFGETWEEHLINLAASGDKLAYIAANIKTPFIQDINDSEYEICSA